MARGRADGRGVGSEVGHVPGVYLDPELTHGPLRCPVELCDQAVQALVPARAVARGLAELIEDIGQGEQGAGAIRPQLDTQPVGAPRRTP